MERSNGDWSAREREADVERTAKHKGGPSLKAKVHCKVVTDDIFGIMWLGRKIKSISKRRTRMVAAFFCALCMCSCAGFHATTGADGGSSLTALNLGGKQMMAGVKSPALQMDQYYSDTEAAFKTFATAAAIAYGINQIAGAYEAVTNAKTAADTTKAVELGKQATSVENTKTTADVIKSVGVPGEVPIAPVALP